MQQILEAIEDCDTPFRMWLRPELIIVLDRPEDVQIVLNSRSCLEKSDIYRFLDKAPTMFGAPGNF